MFPLVGSSEQPQLRVFVEFQMGSAEQSVDILVEGVPLKLGEKGEPEFLRDLGHLFNLSHSDLLLNGETVKEVAAEHQAVLGSEDGVDPTRRDEEGVPGLQGDHATLFHDVAEEDVALPTRQGPVFVGFEICFSWRDEPEDLLALDDVIPDRGASKVDMEVGEATLDTHETVLLHFGILHEPHVVRGLGLVLFQMTRPNTVDPIDLADDFRSNDMGLKLGVRELETDDVQLFGAIWARVVLLPLFHRHFTIFLCRAVHHVDHSLRPHVGFDIGDLNNDIVKGFEKSWGELFFLPRSSSLARSFRGRPFPWWRLECWIHSWK